MYSEIKKCRICGNAELVPILNLGIQALTGVFPRKKDEVITSGPLELVKCKSGKGMNSCGLVQLRHSYDLSELYGDNYGYRSGLNRSMVEHLQKKVKKIEKISDLARADLVIDIGSNDSTLLQAYANKELLLVGFDPSGKKFKEYYPSYIQLIPDFFSERSLRKNFPGKKAKVITSIAMFYDLESPMDFMRQISEVLSDDGIWIFEQSYLPSMLEANAYDTVCHEHLEYYALKQIQWMVEKNGLKIIDLEMNNINGGSFSVTVAKKNSAYRAIEETVGKVLVEESDKGLEIMGPYKEFSERVFKHKEELVKSIRKINASGKKIFGYGASTKGNVILQFCNLKKEDIPFIAEVNKDKFGCFTPGTMIPVISEAQAKAKKPDYFMVLPWHFKENIITREKDYLSSGGKLFFPLPSLQII
ncbi:MAG: class I SAM-dependent methyltransferase [Candidatus Omnitrophica bacterium]|nr:class I SAM-dependent methyltransferase [Candidatus Omnitrophota bacterium]